MICLAKLRRKRLRMSSRSPRSRNMACRSSWARSGMQSRIQGTLSYMVFPGNWFLNSKQIVLDDSNNTATVPQMNETALFQLLLNSKPDLLWNSQGDRAGRGKHDTRMLRVVHKMPFLTACSISKQNS